MTSMLWALKQMRERLPHLSHEIWFAGLMSEETSQHGSKALAREEKFDFVIAAEPTELQVVHTHKGSAFLGIQTQGVSGHASRPELGENAITKMLVLLNFIGGDLTREFSAIQDAKLGAPTISIGTIQGGSKTNIIPDSCEATVDMRFVPAQVTPDLWEKLEARLRAICPDAALDFPFAPPLYTDPAQPLIVQLESLGAKPVGAPWFCDACFFAERGMPAIAMGPGSIRQAHTKDEFISVEDLERGVAFFTKFLGAL